MLDKFVPDGYVKSFKDININNLIDKGIKLFVCDIDNTLVPHDSANMSSEALDFLNSLEKAGLEVVLISNNTAQRVDIFLRDTAYHSYPFAKKPLKTTYKKLLSDYSYNPQEIVCFGDQLLTDVFGGNRMGFWTILSDPLVKRDLSFTKINRLVENGVFALLAKRKMFKHGEYYEM